MQKFFRSSSNPAALHAHVKAIPKGSQRVVNSAIKLLTISLVAAAAPMSASANVPRGDQQVTLNGATQTNRDLSTPLVVEETGSPYGYAIANASGTPSVNAIANTATGAETSVSTRAGLDYWLAISGPAFLGTIPVFYKSTLTANASGFGTGNEASSAVATFVLQSYSAYADGSPYQNLTNQQWSVVAETRYSSPANSKILGVNGVFPLGVGNLLLAAIIADVRSQDGGRASAFADPYFFIDPAFSAEHPGYTLALSPFVGNDKLPSAVPELSTWAGLLIGFGAVGLMARRARLAATRVC